jgi:hypothetical protein
VTLDLNPARLAHFTDWITTLPPRPLPRTVTPVAGEFHLDYIARLAAANHLEFLELAHVVDDLAAITAHRRRWTQHQQERLALAAGQPLDRIARLYWPDPRHYLRDPEAFHQELRPACRRCTARRGITGPVACHLPPHQTLCRRHRLWTGLAARTHAGQLDISPFPEIGRAQRRHLALVHHQHWRHVDAAIKDATRAIYDALRAGTWIPGQQRRMRQLAPGTWHQALDGMLAVSPGRPDHRPGHPAVEIALYPDVIWLAARILRAHTPATAPRADPPPHGFIREKSDRP